MLELHDVCFELLDQKTTDRLDKQWAVFFLNYSFTSITRSTMPGNDLAWSPL